tara:strand:+ start:575 stop:1153 length:579 start_codon:yes stop_codon:yes gene_type:complete
MKSIFTIGHSTHSWSFFLDLIKPYNIDVLVDVRSKPYSKMALDFNRETLKKLLEKENIRYLFMGDKLGGRSNDPDCIVEGRVDYYEIAKSTDFQDGFKRLLKGANEYTVALMCAEKEPLDCHRTILISRHLVDAGLAVNHILQNGQLEEHNETIDRLLLEEKLSQDMFRSKDEVIADAYRERGMKIAYKAEE